VRRREDDRRRRRSEQEPWVAMVQEEASLTLGDAFGEFFKSQQ